MRRLQRCIASVILTIVISSLVASTGFVRQYSPQEEHNNDNAPELNDRNANALNTFYRWDDSSGVNITDMITYHDWLAREGIAKERTGYNNWPVTPLVIVHDNATNKFQVKMSRSMVRDKI